MELKLRAEMRPDENKDQALTRIAIPQLAKTCDTTPDSASFSDSGKP